jgi:hypothetical protein
MAGTVMGLAVLSGIDGWQGQKSSLWINIVCI